MIQRDFHVSVFAVRRATLLCRALVILCQLQLLFCYSVRFCYIYCRQLLTDSAQCVCVLFTFHSHSLCCYFITAALLNRMLLLFSIPANAYKFSIFCCAAHVRRDVWRDAVTRSALNRTKINYILFTVCFCRAQVSCRLLRFSAPFSFCLIRWLYAPTRTGCRRERNGKYRTIGSLSATLSPTRLHYSLARSHTCTRPKWLPQ